MAEEKDAHVAEPERESTERPPWWKRLWGGRGSQERTRQRKVWTLREFWGKPVWDWLQLLSVLAIPVVLTGAGFYFEAQLDERQRKTEDRRANLERELEEQRAQDEALQAYLNQMSTLLLEKDLSDEKVQTLLRARTLTVLGSMDPSRKTHVILFLAEASLIQSVDEKAPIIVLRDADLSGANLSGANLSDAYLRDTDLRGANLSNTNLRDANLFDANLSGANLRDAYLNNAALGYAQLRGAALSYADLYNADLNSAYLNNADLSYAQLEGATLSGAHLSDADLSDAHPIEARLYNTDLSGANLSGTVLTNAILWQANLRGANLSGTVLLNADLSEADLSGAYKYESRRLESRRLVTNEELEEELGTVLSGATMPNGQKYEDWIQSKGGGETTDNSGPS